MTISFVLDWASFWVGSVATVLTSFLLLVVVAAVQYRKQKRKGSRRI